MKKVITYGTYDLLHYGHTRLLERAKALGDYLIVGVTSDDFDKRRGKINVQQSLIERIQGVKDTGLADEIIVEEYEGQKIDDIINLGVDVFAIGSDWEGKFDYLKDYCEVVYLPRTEGISSSDIRSDKRNIKFGIIGSGKYIGKIAKESKYVNGIELSALCSSDDTLIDESLNDILKVDSFEALLNISDAIYIQTNPKLHYEEIKEALNMHKHVICESPIALTRSECEELFNLAKENKCILVDAIKTAYATAYTRLLLLIKGGIVGQIVSVDSVCTSLAVIEQEKKENYVDKWNSICSWGPTGLLPILQILGTNYEEKSINTFYFNKETNYDGFTNINFIYKNAVATTKVGKGIKSEGELIITGTKGYIYVPAPWWKTDYFEIRFENSSENKRYFYKLDGDGIRNELVSFVKAVASGRKSHYINEDVSSCICALIEDFDNKKDLKEL